MFKLISLLTLFFLIAKNSLAINQDVYEKAKINKINLSGWYINHSNKLNDGRYFLPGIKFIKNIKNQFNDNFYFITGFAWVDFDNNNTQDIIFVGEGHRCGSGNTTGENLEQEGRRGCSIKGAKMLNAVKPPVLTFLQDAREQEIIHKDNLFDWSNQFGEDLDYGATLARLIIDDFNNDNVDDIFIANAQVQIRNKKYEYIGPNHTLISKDKLNWKQSIHTGFKTEKKQKIYTGFSHGSTSGDIDNDGDIDIITTEFKGAVCHFNDGEGNFKAKICANQGGFAVTAADYNSDGNLDLIISGDHYNPKFNEISPSGWKGDPGKNRISVFYGNGKGKFKRQKTKIEPVYTLGGKFMFSQVVDMISWDFDNDGDVDFISSVVGPFYSSSAFAIYENIGNGKFKPKNSLLFPGVEPNPAWADPKEWAKEIKDEYSHPYNSYCNRTALIDVNNDNLMDAICVNGNLNKHTNWFFINKGDLIFEMVDPSFVEDKGWVFFYDNLKGKKIEGIDLTKIKKINDQELKNYNLLQNSIYFSSIEAKMIGGKNFNLDIDNNYYIFDALFEKDEIKFPVTLCTQYYPKFTFIGNRVGFNYGEGFGNISKLKKYGTGACGNQNTGFLGHWSDEAIQLSNDTDLFPFLREIESKWNEVFNNLPFLTAEEQNIIVEKWVN